MKENYDVKMAVISGASHALQYKDRNPRATEQEILQHITDNMDEILEKMEHLEEE